jgi:hypothetical protein
MGSATGNSWYFPDNKTDVWEIFRPYILYKADNEFGIPTELVRLNTQFINMCTCKHFSDVFAIQNGPMQDALLPGLFNFAKQYAIKGVQAKYE